MFGFEAVGFRPNFGRVISVVVNMAPALPKPHKDGVKVDFQQGNASQTAIGSTLCVRLAQLAVGDSGTVRTALLKSAYTRRQFEYMLGQANFRSVEIREEGIGFAISMTK